MLVRDFMTKNPTTVDPDDMAEKIYVTMKKLNFRQCPVVQDGALVGIVTDGDIEAFMGRGTELKVKDAMITNPVTILDYASVEGAADLMRSRKFNALPVLSNKNKLIGIISVTDIMDAFLNLLSFHEKPIRLEVDMSDDVSLFDVLHVIQSNSEKVISFSAATLDRKVYYFWVVNCKFGQVEKELSKKNSSVSVVYSERENEESLS